MAMVLNLCNEVTTTWIGEPVGRQLSIVCLTIAYTDWGSYADREKNLHLTDMEKNFPHCLQDIYNTEYRSLTFKLRCLHLGTKSLILESPLILLVCEVVKSEIRFTDVVKPKSWLKAHHKQHR